MEQKTTALPNQIAVSLFTSTKKHNVNINRINQLNKHEPTRNL